MNWICLQHDAFILWFQLHNWNQQRKGKNSYDKYKSNHFDVVKVEGDTKEWKPYEIKKLINKRTQRFERIEVTQYPVRWLRYESKYHEWKNLFALINCMKLIEEFEVKSKNIIKSFKMKKTKKKEMNKTTMNKTTMKKRDRFRKNDWRDSIYFTFDFRTSTHVDEISFLSLALFLFNLASNVIFKTHFFQF